MEDPLFEAQRPLVHQQDRANNLLQWRLVLQFFLPTMVFCTPFFMATLDMNNMGRDVLCTITLPSNSKVDVLTWTFPYYCAFLAFRCKTVVPLFWNPPKAEISRFEVIGRTFYMRRGFVLQWHIWIASHLIDLLFDSRTSQALIHEPIKVWIKVAWAFTNCMAFLIPLAYVLGRLTYYQAVLFELTLEDALQTFIGFYQLFDVTRHSIPMTLIFSAIFATLGIVEGIATVKAWLPNVHERGHFHEPARQLHHDNAEYWHDDAEQWPEELMEIHSACGRCFRRSEPCFRVEGQFGPVWEAVETHPSAFTGHASNRFAVKQVNLWNVQRKIIYSSASEVADDLSLDNIPLEIDLLAELQQRRHKHIVELEEVVFLRRRCVCIVLRWGGLSWLAHLNNFAAAQITTNDADPNVIDAGLVVQWRFKLLRQLMEAVRFLHEDMGCCHLDISLENAIIDVQDANAVNLRVIDFGLARKLEVRTVFATKKYRPQRVGKLSCMAPEIYENSGFDGALCDAWSVGMVAYEVIVGSQLCKVPDSDIDDGFAALKSGNWDRIRELNNRSTSLHGLEARVIEGLLQIPPEARLNIKQAITLSATWNSTINDLPPPPVQQVTLPCQGSSQLRYSATIATSEMRTGTRSHVTKLYYCLNCSSSTTDTCITIDVWSVWRTYSDFLCLYRSLQGRFPLPAFPPKSLFRRALSKKFMRAREKDLDTILEAILPMAQLDEVQKFLGVSRAEAYHETTPGRMSLWYQSLYREYNYEARSFEGSWRRGWF